MKKNQWYKVKAQSLAVYTRNAGFDLSVYDDYSEDVQEEVKKLAIKEALTEIKIACDEKGFDIAAVKKGVYVISLSNPLSIKYQEGRSDVIYIGMGNILSRIEGQFKNNLFEFMQSLSGANFDFHFARPTRHNAVMYYKHVEYLMLEYFSKQYGGITHESRFPILNKNAGTNKHYKVKSHWWTKPLKASGKKPQWELNPTKFSEFVILDDGL